LIGAVIPTTLLVLDCDPRNGGSFEGLQAVLGELPPTLTCVSGRGDGGFHAYYLRPGGSLSSTRLPAGIDLKTNGFMIVPPSIHPATGRPYRWIHRPPVGLPERAVRALRPAERSQIIYAPGETEMLAARSDALIRTVATAPEGRRNQLLYWAALRAITEDHGPDVLDALDAAGQTCGLDPIEVRRTMQSAARRAGAVA
jgi:hypothetical protein